MSARVVMGVVLPAGQTIANVDLPEGAIVIAELIEPDELIEIRTIVRMGESTSVAVIRAMQRARDEERRARGLPV